MKAKTKERGFTLVELMIVVAIIAILAVIAIPMYSGYVKKAKITEALTGIDAIKSAEVVYYQKNGSFFADPNDPTNLSDLGVNLDRTKWDYEVSTSAPEGDDCENLPNDGDIYIIARATSGAGSGLEGGRVCIVGKVNNGSIQWMGPYACGAIKQSDLP